VSILDRAATTAVFDVPDSWAFVACLCFGGSVEDHAEPELRRLKWQPREAACRQVLRRGAVAVGAIGNKI